MFACLSAVSFLLALDKVDTRKIETVGIGTNAVLTLSFEDETIDISDIQKLQCSVELNNITRLLGNWTTGTSTPILRLEPSIEDIFDHRLTVSYRNNIVSLSLTNTTYSDSGVYSCSSPKGQKSEINLQIRGGPVFVSKNFSDLISLDEGSSVSFQLTFCGNPKPKVNWVLNSRNATSVDGEAEESAYGFRSDHISQKYNLNTHCYKFVYVTPKLYRDPCNQTAVYNVEGDHSKPITGRVAFSVSFQPEPVTDVTTKSIKDCLLTKWTGPFMFPGRCDPILKYSIEVVRKSKAMLVYTSYSNNYLLCSMNIGNLNEVTDIRVSYTNKFGKSRYVSSTFSSTPPGTKATVAPGSSANENNSEDGSFKNIAIATSGLLGLCFFAFIIFIVYYIITNYDYKFCSQRSVKIEEGKNVVKNDKKKQSSPTENKKKPIGTISSKLQRKSRLQKENIVHKPRSLSQVTSNNLVKSHTFSGYDAFNHRYGGEETLQKGYMPLNTLQRRISESLQSINNFQPPKKVSSLPMFDEIFENANAELDEEERKRASGASAETECTSLSTVDNIRGSHLSLGRTYSLESAISDYDMPYTIEVDRSRRKSIYDFPRTPLAEHKETPATTYDVTKDNNKTPKYSEYARPSDVIKRRTSLEEDDLRRKRMSTYSTPRKSVVIPEEKDIPDGKSSSATPQRRDDKVIYDKPRLEPVKSVGFEAPVISQVTGLYDTPRVRAQENNSTVDGKAGEKGLSSTLGGSSENLYDNINFILTKYGCAATSDLTEPAVPGHKHTDC